MNSKTSVATAIAAKNLSKIYKLYGNVTDQAIDILGLKKLFFWHKIEPTDFPALKGINFNILHGERVGIIGQNGAGKTTLLKLITGAISHSDGTLEVNGDIQALMQVGLGFHPEFTGRENIEASLLYSGLRQSEKKEAEEDIIDFCELGQFLDQPLKTYSLGMQARLQFACATAIKPDILIVDEILGAGDAYFSRKSSARMEKLTKSGCTLLLVSHSMGQVLQFCQRVIWINDGMIKMDGNSRDVINEYEIFTQEKADRLLNTEENIEDPVEKISLKLAESATNDDSDLPNSKLQNRSEKSKIQLSDGQWAYRWPSEEGLKLDSLGLFHNGKHVSRIPIGAKIELRGKVLCETTGSFSCYYFLRINNISELYVTRLCSEKIEFNGKKGDIQEFTIELDPCLLEPGDFYLAFNIIPGDDLIEAPSRRYDLVTSFCDFKVFRTLDYIESSVYVQPANWYIQK